MLTLLQSKNLGMKVVVFDYILEIGYLRRKETVDAMLNGGLTEKLVELQRSEFGGDLIEMGKYSDENEESWGSREDGVGIGEGNFFYF
ncbi:hypothetical protein J1N35_035284 [Gossypium stocksii]|uniref:Uncharacterized protein n=1 Tax=Gossypium stocksii TaxID=47602 RepID=A0A9D3ZQT9_9ROSI|nr:hypothetical protein J1N35_035284 [Gossypium stocksii]